MKGGLESATDGLRKQVLKVKKGGKISPHAALRLFGCALSWPLVGRTEEMRTIEAAISASDVAGILICGAAGVGKSRIAREALSAAASAGLRNPLDGGHIVGTGDSARCFHCVGAVGCHRHRSVAAGSDRVADRRAVGRQGGRWLSMTYTCSMICPRSSCIRSWQRGAAKVILTVRDGEPIPPAIQEIWKAGQFDRLDLQQLSLDETATLLSATLAGPVDADAAERLWKLTRGNVLYLRNIVEQEVADGRIVQENGYWRWIGDPIMPPGLVELIESRIGTLPDAGQRCDRRAGGRGADRTCGPDADHRCRRGRGGRNPWPHHARARRWRRRGAGGASALWRGAPQARAAQPATTAARTGRHRTRRIQ